MKTFILWYKGKAPKDWNDKEFGKREFSIDCHPLRKDEKIQLFIRQENDFQKRYNVTVKKVRLVIGVVERELGEQLVFVSLD